MIEIKGSANRRVSASVWLITEDAHAIDFLGNCMLFLYHEEIFLNPGQPFSCHLHIQEKE
ncbi:MAG TPA: hypothetical protein ENJ12_02745 [Thiolapillus brandeum]|uniref:Uncharacterized protein n=1 Tax=Thiolapillus brandeum TaxID=1076588 RepID=A0A831RV37_9GAMM|nr:hypothetical protein [Thiolapillus brandeum]